MGLPETQRGFSGRLTPEGYPTSSEQFPVLPPEQRLPSNDYGQADQYDVPQINVDPAPMAHAPLMEQHPRSPTDMDALSPPEQRGMACFSGSLYSLANTKQDEKETACGLNPTPTSLAPLPLALLHLLSAQPTPPSLAIIPSRRMTWLPSLPTIPDLPRLLHAHLQHVGHPLPQSLTATIYSSWQIRIVLQHQAPRSGSKNTRLPSPATFAPRNSPGRITCGLICEPTPTNALSCAQSAPKLSHASTIESDMKGCTVARRNLFAGASLALEPRGVAAAGSREQMH